jgi:hypothetical protein
LVHICHFSAHNHFYLSRTPSPLPPPGESETLYGMGRRWTDYATAQTGWGKGEACKVLLYNTGHAEAKPNDLFIRFKPRSHWAAPYGGQVLCSERRTIRGHSEDASSNCGGNSTLIQFPAIALIYDDQDVNYVTGKQLPVVTVSGGPCTCSCT